MFRGHGRQSQQFLHHILRSLILELTCARHRSDWPEWPLPGCSSARDSANTLDGSGNPGLASCRCARVLAGFGDAARLALAPAAPASVWVGRRSCGLLRQIDEERGHAPEHHTDHPSRLKMPQFMPAPSAESDWPAQAAQARSGPGCRARQTQRQNPKSEVRKRRRKPKPEDRTPRCMTRATHR